ncbi:DUF6624 domain-containing protein [Streptomyces luteireticuli]|uniref:DUF6624 domain-containing protein n=1 Tax=Streptomyces luteireticuli TaxID=173858 RepID=UPI003557F073
MRELLAHEHPPAHQPDTTYTSGLSSPGPLNREVAALLCRLHQEGLTARTTRDRVPVKDELLTMVRWEQRATRELAQILHTYGWPGPAMVGDVAAEAAWWSVLMSDRYLDFQRFALHLLTEAVNHQRAPDRHLAYLTDRLLMHDGQPQLYGTQYVLLHDTTVHLHPVASLELLAERRHRAGLKHERRDADMHLLALTRGPLWGPRPASTLPASWRIR